MLYILSIQLKYNYVQSLTYEKINIIYNFIFSFINHQCIRTKSEEGDLNKDKLNDKVVVEMDLKDETRPLRLQIFLSQLNKKRQLVVSSTH